MACKNIKTILLISLSNLGDIVLTTPVLQKLYQVYPEARIDVITGAPGKEIFILHPRVRDVYVTQDHRKPKRRIKQVFDLRKRKYDLVVDLKKTFLPFFLGVKSSYKSGIKPPSKHKRDEHLSRLSTLDVDPFADAKFFLPVKVTDVELADKIITESGVSKFAIVNPGAKSHLKRWPSAKYAQLCDRIFGELGLRCFIVGAGEDREIINEVISKCVTNPIDVCNKTTVGALAHLMKKAEVVITNDSAPLHIASAVNAPTVAIFAPTDEEKYGPLADKRKVLTPSLECRPCEQALCSVGPDEGCIVQVEVEDVFLACKEITA